MASSTVYSRRQYAVASAAHGQEIAEGVVGTWDLDDDVSYGLPEVDDRYHVWRVPVLSRDSTRRVGEIVINAKTGTVDCRRSTTVSAVRARLKRCGEEDSVSPVEDGDTSAQVSKGRSRKKAVITPPELRNSIMQGRSEELLRELPAESVQLMFTSPPYFNARPDYADYHAYEDYLTGIRQVLREVHRVLEDGRFAVINTSPVLLRRAKRSESSKRIAVPFDIHRIAIEEGFEFIDDIIWVKPEGAGWATGRGRRFAADRNPLQYKAVPVTEYVMVYRKKTDRLIDWHIRNHSNPEAVTNSKIQDGYEKTNIWRITPAHSKLHPAVFPQELAEKVIAYYSFQGDTVLDPYAGIGTVGAAASTLHRKFVLCELNAKYVDVIRDCVPDWLGPESENVQCVNCAPIERSDKASKADWE